MAVRQSQWGSADATGRGPGTLRHYTDKKGHDAIIDSQRLKVSRYADNPKDARHGDGIYLTDLSPVDGLTQGQIAKRLWNDTRKMGKLAYFVDIDVSGLDVIEGAPNNYVVLSDDAYFDVSGRNR